MSTASKVSIGVIIVIMVGVAITATVMGYSARFYLPTEVQELNLTQNIIIKVGGQVQPTSLKVYKKTSKKQSSIRFTLLDKEQQIGVRYTGKKPQFLEEGKFIVAVGVMKNKTLQATSLLDHYYFFYILAAYLMATLVLCLGLLSAILKNHAVLRQLQATLPLETTD
jgi:cytochrome c-type biogenesis protein CcmE